MSPKSILTIVVMDSPMRNWIPGPRCARPGMTGEMCYNPSTIFATISRWISEEPPKIV